MSCVEKSNKLTALTGFRGIAALWVVIYHITSYLEPYLFDWVLLFIYKGYLAVDFFFILSGFVIALNYHYRLVHNLNGKHINKFLMKRIARIYPLHLFLLLLYLFIPMIYISLGKEFEFSGRFAIDSYLFSVFLVNNWGFTSELPWNIPSWSISTEFAAYLIFPLLVKLFGNEDSRLLPFFVIVASCGAIAFIFKVSNLNSIGESIVTTGLIRCLLEFTIGVALFQIYRRHKKHIYNKGPIILFIGVIGFSIMIFTDFIYDYLLAPISTIFIILGTLGQRDVNLFLSTPILIWLGNISYSVYLCHYLIKDLMKMVFIGEQGSSLLWVLSYLVVVIFASHFLYYFFELPSKRKLMNSYYQHTR